MKLRKSIRISLSYALIICLAISFCPLKAIALDNQNELLSQSEPVNTLTNEASIRTSIAEDTNSFLEESDSYTEGVDYAEHQMILSFDVKKFEISSVNDFTDDYLNEFHFGNEILDSCTYSVIGVVPKSETVVQVSASLPESMSTKEGITGVSLDSRILGAIPNYYYSTEDDLEGGTSQIPDDPCFTNKGSWVYELTGVRKAWNYQKTENSVTIAIIDGGFDLSQLDLVNRFDTSHAYDAYNNEPLTQNSARAQQPYTGHGTAVAATAAATVRNAFGNAGTSHNAKVIPIASAIEGNPNSLDYQSIIRGLQRIATIKKTGETPDLKVVNMSFGSYNPNKNTMYRALLSHLRNDLDITIVASAGNRSKSNSTYDNTTFHQPSDFDECVSVTAVDQTGTFMSGYAHNQYKDIAAPGTDYYLPATSGYAYWSGTSFASPHVAGVVALIRSAAPDLSATDVEKLLYSTARDAGATGKDDYYGNGILDAEKTVMKACGINYTDIDSDEWYVYYGFLKYVTQNKLILGYTDTTLFGPHDCATRAQVVAILYRIACPEEQVSDPSQYSKNETSFVDCEDYQWYTGAMNWAAKNNLISGDSSTNRTTARPNDSVSREELAAFMCRYANFIGEDISAKNFATPNVTDWEDVDDWAQDVMKWCYYHQVISGWDNGDGTASMLPHSTSDRAQLTKVMTMAHKRFQD